MKTNKLSFDFSDNPEIVEMLRMEAVRTKSSQKGILIEALESYFSNKLGKLQPGDIKKVTTEFKKLFEVVLHTN